MTTLAQQTGGSSWLANAGLMRVLDELVRYGRASIAASTLFVASRHRALPREAEAGNFFGVGMLGLVLIHTLLFAFVSGLGFSAGLARAPTAAIVLLIEFGHRRGLVFAASARS